MVCCYVPWYQKGEEKKRISIEGRGGEEAKEKRGEGCRKNRVEEVVEEEPTATKENEEMLTKEDEEETTTKQDEEAAAEEDEEVLIADKVDERNTNNTENKENRLTAWSKLITRTVGLEQVVSTIPHVDCQKMGSVHC